MENNHKNKMLSTTEHSTLKKIYYYLAALIFYIKLNIIIFTTVHRHICNVKDFRKTQIRHVILC